MHLPDKFSLSAKTFWNNIPSDIRERLLDNVYCTKCRSMTTITGYSGRIEQWRNGEMEQRRIGEAADKKSV